jgi:hypothetical protein
MLRQMCAGEMKARDPSQRQSAGTIVPPEVVETEVCLVCDQVAQASTTVDLEVERHLARVGFYASAVARCHHDFNDDAYVFPCICHPRQPCSLTVSPGDHGPQTQPCPSRPARMYDMREVEETAERLVGAQAVGPRAAIRGDEGRVSSKSQGRVDDAQIVYRKNGSRALVNARHVMALRNQERRTEIACDEQSCQVVVYW